MSKLCFVNYMLTQFERTFQFASEVAQAVDYAYNLFDICHTLMNNIYGRLPVPTTPTSSKSSSNGQGDREKSESSISYVIMSSHLKFNSLNLVHSGEKLLFTSVTSLHEFIWLAIFPAVEMSVVKMTIKCQL